MKKVCMIVPDKMVKGGIAAVISGYYGSELEDKYNIIYVESYKDGSKLTKLIKAIQGYFHFVKVLLVDHPDIIHIHSSFGPSFYRKLPFIYMASWAKKPIINHIHGANFDEFYGNASEQKRALVRKIYNKCAVLIALSEEWKERLSQIVPAEKITIIENYSILHGDVLNDRLSRESNKTVLFLGEIGKRKGCYDIPAVVAEVVKDVPDVRFILGGAGNLADEQAIKALFVKYGVSSHILFPGWVRGKDKDKLLRDADVFFLPSYNEGMPMSVLDAMGYGLPVVSTNVGGIPQIVHNGENGYCYEPGDVSGFAEGIKKILNGNIELFSEKSIQIIKNGYSDKLHFKKIEDVYSLLH